MNILAVTKPGPEMMAALTDDLRAPAYRGNPNPLAGHCYVTAEAMYHRGLANGWTVRPMFIRHEGQPHWFVLALLPGDDDTWMAADPTASQFSTPVPYHEAKGKGFLTKAPSKRARTLMARLGWA